MMGFSKNIRSKFFLIRDGEGAKNRNREHWAVCGGFGGGGWLKRVGWGARNEPQHGYRKHRSVQVYVGVRFARPNLPGLSLQ